MDLGSSFLGVLGQKFANIGSSLCHSSFSPKALNFIMHILLKALNFIKRIRRWILVKPTTVNSPYFPNTLNELRMPRKKSPLSTAAWRIETDSITKELNGIFYPCLERTKNKFEFLAILPSKFILLIRRIRLTTKNAWKNALSLLILDQNQKCHFSNLAIWNFAWILQTCKAIALQIW